MKKLIVLVAALIAIMVLFVYASSQKTNFFSQLFTVSPSQHASASTINPTTTNTNPFNTKIVDLVIKKNELAQGPRILQAGQGQVIVLRITSDVDDELSLLGYDKHVFLQKGKMVILSFLSTLTGNFSYKLEDSKTILGVIDITK